VYPEKLKSVPDPYYNDDAFEPVFRMLDKACAVYIAKFL